MLKLKRAYESASKEDGMRFPVSGEVSRELDSRPEAWRPIRVAARGRTVTLVYSSHDEEHNNAVALQEYLQAKQRRRRASSR